MCVCVCVVEGRHAGTWRCWWQTTQSIQTRAVTICNVIYWIVCSGHAAVAAADAIYLIFVFIYAARTRGKIKCIRRIKRIIQMHLLLLRTSKMCQMANVRKEEEMFHIGTHTHTHTLIAAVFARLWSVVFASAAAPNACFRGEHEVAENHIDDGGGNDN